MDIQISDLADMLWLCDLTVVLAAFRVKKKPVPNFGGCVRARPLKERV